MDTYEPILFWLTICEMSVLKAEEQGIDPDGHRGLIWTMVVLAHYDMPEEATNGLQQQQDSRRKLEALVVEAHDRNLVEGEHVLKAVDWEPFEMPTYFYWLAEKILKVVKAG